MPLDFSNPAQGPLGAGMAQNAGAMLKWRPIYQKYVMDSSERGEEPMPMEQFIQTIVTGAQGMTPPGAAPAPAPVQPAPATGGGLMHNIRGLFR